MTTRSQRTIEPGALLVDERGNHFIYLGYYAGVAPVRNSPTEGYLYVRVEISETALLCQPDAIDDMWLYANRGLIHKLSYGPFPFSAIYARNPMSFVAKERTINLSRISHRLRSVEGLIYVKNGRHTIEPNGGKTK